MRADTPSLIARNKLWSLISPALFLSSLLLASILMFVSGPEFLRSAAWYCMYIFGALVAGCLWWIWGDGLFQRRRALLIDDQGIWFRPGWRKATIISWPEIEDVEVKELVGPSVSMKYINVTLHRLATTPNSAPSINPGYRPPLEIYTGDLDCTEDDVFEAIQHFLSESRTIVGN